MIRLEIDEAINGFRVNINTDIYNPTYKENTETYIEALKILRLRIEHEIKIEQDSLQQAVGQIH